MKSREKIVTMVLLLSGVVSAAGLWNGLIENKPGLATGLSGGQIVTAGITKWTANGAAVCASTEDQRNAKTCTDDIGGAIIAWEDHRSTTNWDIYAQRINATTGATVWAAGGVAICTATGDQSSIAMCSDGAGGAIIAWVDHRGSTDDIYAQHVTAAGSVLWIADGMVICNNAAGNQVSPVICSDGAGGAIIAWEDYRSTTNWDIFTYRVSSGGNRYWDINGTEICANTANQLENVLCSDGAGGAYITWTDFRNAATNIYVQYINATGDGLYFAADGDAVTGGIIVQSAPEICSDGAGGCYIAWQEIVTGTMLDIKCRHYGPRGGAPWTFGTICNSAENQYDPVICADGAGGAIVAWRDNRTLDNNFNVYAQRIDNTCGIIWTSNGVVVSNAAGQQLPRGICADGEGGAIIAIQDGRSGINTYAQHVNATGDMTWQANGIGISTTTYSSLNVVECSDGIGGAIIVWEENRGSGKDIYTQRVNMAGPGKWAANGLGACTASDQKSELHSCSDGLGGMLMAWSDYRSGSPWQIYVQRFNATGAPIWASNGLQVSVGISNWSHPQICSDGLGGALIAASTGSGSTVNIFAQHVNYKGETMWPSPVSICAATDVQRNPVICSNGAGAAIIAWEDYRSGTNWDIYAQGVNDIGVTWASNGVCIVNATGNQLNPVICSDGQRGALIAWEDSRDVDMHIYVQRILYNGARMAAGNGTAISVASPQKHPSICSNGLGGALVTYANFGGDYDIAVARIDGGDCSVLGTTTVCSATLTQDYPKICTDGQGGAIMTWQDIRSGTTQDVYAKRVNSAGTNFWAVNGVLIIGTSGDQTYPQICSDGLGGAIIACVDSRTGDLDIRARRIDSSGTALWSTGGVDICAEGYNQDRPVICSDGAGGALVSWRDYRAISPNAGIYAQHVLMTGAMAPATFNMLPDASVPDGDGIFNLNWVPSTGAVDFSVYRHTSPFTTINTSLVTIASGLSSSTFTLAITYPHSGVYYYVVVANNSIGQTLSPSRMVNITIAPGVFYITTSAGNPDTDGIFNVNWTASAGAISYTVYRFDHPIIAINGSLTTVSSGLTSLGYHVSGLSSGVYYYAIGAINATGKTLSSGYIKATVLITVPPGSFTLSSNAGTPDDNGAFDLTWTASAGATSYAVYEYGHPITNINGSLSSLGNTTSLTHSITGLTNGSYYYLILASNTDGTTMSNCIMITVGIPPSAPGISMGNFHVIFLLAAVAMLALITRRKKIRVL